LDHQQTPDSPGEVTPPAPNGDGSAEEPQPSLRTWLVTNGVTLLLIVSAIVALYVYLGPEWMWNVGKVVVGLGFVVFIHELGHFLVAKWCDVHVQTFSIGFGPALPWCSYKWGETTYKLAMIPLGGYVKMVGEGGEGEEGEEDPRSFKNKSVGQRMAIISAGVVMNLILGAICFVIAFKAGVQQHIGAVGFTEIGGPAWTKGVRSDWQFARVESLENPAFEDIRMDVMTTSSGEAVPFVFKPSANGSAENNVAITIEPRKMEGEPNPVIGVGEAVALKLPGEKDVEDALTTPFRRNSSAAAARALDLNPGDVVLATTNPDKPDADDLENLPPPSGGELFNSAALGDRLRRLTGKAVKLKVRQAGEEKVITLEPGTGFQWEDAIVGTSDPDSHDPFKTLPLPIDTFHYQGGQHRDYFEFLRRMSRMAGRGIIIQVQRKGAPDGSTVNLFLPPEYNRVFPGVRMVMGQVVGVREQSSADSGGVKKEDIILEIKLSAGDDSVRFVANPSEDDKKDPKFQQLDPLRLRDQLRAWVKDRPGVLTTITVRRAVPEEKLGDKPVTLTDLPWDNSWRFNEELPSSHSGGLSIPELGIAFQVKSEIADVPAWVPLTDEALQSLLAATVENAVLSRVAGLKDKQFSSREEFAKELTKILHEEQESSEKLLGRLKPLKDEKFFARKDFLDKVAGIVGKEAMPEFEKILLQHVADTGSPTARGLRKGDLILSMNVLTPSKDSGKPEFAKEPSDLRPKDKKNADPEPRWGYQHYALQTVPFDTVRLMVRHSSGEEQEIEVDLTPDRTWPLHDSRETRGLLFMPALTLSRADGLGEALHQGMRYTWRMVMQTYLGLRSFLTGRLSVKDHLGGPIDIAYGAFKTAERGTWPDFIRFLGMISVNLAVVNFLPIPILDGGHMVFLIYEKLRGRKPSETVRAAATWVGALMLVGLMVLAIGLGVYRRL
jgi:membrane-associated protease RseP (regulator of RpoE activity)